MDESGDQDLDAEINPPTASGTTAVVSTRNPLKRPRPKDDSNKDKGMKALLAGGGVLSFNANAFALFKKIQVGSPTVMPFLQSVLQVELKRAIRMRGLKGLEKKSAKERDKHTLNMAFHPAMREQVTSARNALTSGEIRTLMDPFREKVSVLVLTDPRLIRYPNGVLMRKLSACVTLSDAVHREFPDDEERLCSVLATGICKLLQPKFQLSVAGLELVVRALKCVLLERIGEDLWHLVRTRELGKESTVRLQPRLLPRRFARCRGGAKALEVLLLVESAETLPERKAPRA